jgi:hypothetical protein
LFSGDAGGGSGNEADIRGHRGRCWAAATGFVANGALLVAKPT